MKRDTYSEQLLDRLFSIGRPVGHRTKSLKKPSQNSRDNIHDFRTSTHLAAVVLAASAVLAPADGGPPRRLLRGSDRHLHCHFASSLALTLWSSVQMGVMLVWRTRASLADELGPVGHGVTLSSCACVQASRFVLLFYFYLVECGRGDSCECGAAPCIRPVWSLGRFPPSGSARRGSLTCRAALPFTLYRARCRAAGSSHSPRPKKLGREVRLNLVSAWPIRPDVFDGRATISRTLCSGGNAFERFLRASRSFCVSDGPSRRE